MKRWFLNVLMLAWVCFPTGNAFAALNVDRLTDADIAQAKKILAELEPLIREREAKENLSTLTFEELYAPLNESDRNFLKSFQDLSAKDIGVRIPFREIATGKEPLVVIKGQKVAIDGKLKELPPQFLPPDVYQRYLVMMDAMKKDLGKRLYVESGYRSSAYQLYLFVFYLKNHAYSIRETVKWVALPGYSEHGSPSHQAIDFISEDGISGEENPQLFEDLAEYKWLLKNAARFGFVLSYPKNDPKGTTYEPWHWRYERNL